MYRQPKADYGGASARGVPTLAGTAVNLSGFWDPHSENNRHRDPCENNRHRDADPSRLDPKTLRDRYGPRGPRGRCFFSWGSPGGAQERRELNLYGLGAAGLVAAHHRGARALQHALAQPGGRHRIVTVNHATSEADPGAALAPWHGCLLPLLYEPELSETRVPRAETE